MNISLKEAYEVRYWLLLLASVDYIESPDSYLNEIDEIIRMFVKIVKTSKENESAKK